MSDIKLPRGPASGARAVDIALGAGFLPVSSGPVPRHLGEIRTVLEHPDGRRLDVYTTVGSVSLIKAVAVDRDMWPDGVGSATSVPGVARMVNAT